ncbi:putative deoxyribonuclease TATDN1 isoform X2 [Pieris rapae]|uniref:putative deoxyribonuclease TATDN1 isoform X2 n=1 Tax=Pieris rapae TaxID=64459 RepID=UPI001E279DB9|nr:putative deoxyribonuclease TATDN1 isoform X2 [Pieris rapae]
MANLKKYIDIGANLTDGMYRGIYHGLRKHDPDLHKVLDRAWSGGLNKIIITGGSLSESKEALELAQTDSRLFSTVGCHPTRCDEFLSDSPETYLSDLSDLILDNKDKIVAIGEFGLDYERLNFCQKDVQLKYFELQLQLCHNHKLPLFLHCRAAADDLVSILERHRDNITGGVVHSFDGSYTALQKILDLNLHIGINGCSLRTEENLEVVAKIPQDKLLIETDSPWCEVKPTHPGHKHVVTKRPTVKKEKLTLENDSLVKGRNEPVNIVQVLEILAAVRNEDINELAEAIYENTTKLFFKDKMC